MGAEGHLLDGAADLDASVGVELHLLRRRRQHLVDGEREREGENKLERNFIRTFVNVQIRTKSDENRHISIQ